MIAPNPGNNRISNITQSEEVCGSPGNNTTAPYYDDRMYLLDVEHTTTFSWPYDTKEGEDRWSVITRGNWRDYPITRTDDFDSYEAAVKYLKSVSPQTPLVSLSGRALSPIPTWSEFQHWLIENGLPPMPY